MQRAILLTHGLFKTDQAKTAHGLIRESLRYQIVGVVDHQHHGNDAGILLDGTPRNIPIYATVRDALQSKPDVCIVGVATVGGMFPGTLLNEVKEAIQLHLDIINGLHDYLSAKPEIAKLAQDHGVTLLDIRIPKKIQELHFWTGKILQLQTPIIAIIGTDCALGKRTTARFIMNACNDAGLNTQMIYTGQTGWLQGGKYGFIVDSTLNDFVSGELEYAILQCQAATNPDIIFLEGQSALRNPSGPCGAELLISGNAKSVILVHAPKRINYEHEKSWGAIPTLESEIALIRLLGSTVIGIALNTESCSTVEARAFQQEYQQKFNVPILLPLYESCEKILPVIKKLAKPTSIA
ncbi:MAG: DUF1611 domain-containing protein [Bacteroidetes bacterium]|nr:DUF1611 domain-containing protein [Bacteroidota bacterium]